VTVCRVFVAQAFLRYFSRSVTCPDECSRLKSECQSVEDDLEQAEQRLTTSMAEVTALTDNLRHASSEKQRLQRELQSMHVHQAQLETEVATKTDDIAQHQPRLQARRAAMQVEIHKHQAAIQTSVEDTQRFKQETLALHKQVRRTHE
jgi:chromosome segregation ATPase